MGRFIGDGKAVDVAAPAATHIEKGELYRISNFTGFAMDDITTTEVDRQVALERSERVWRVKVPVGTCATLGNFVKWTDTGGVTFQRADTLLLDDGAIGTLNTIGQVMAIRNSRGYADIKLRHAK